MTPPFIVIPASLQLTHQCHLQDGRLLFRGTAFVAFHIEGEKLIFSTDSRLESLEKKYSPKGGELPLEWLPEPDHKGNGLGKVTLFNGEEVSVLAKWEARRDVQEWEVAPVVSFLLVASQSRVRVVERADVLSRNSPVPF